MAARKGLLLARNTNMLVEYGGHVNLSRNLAQVLLERIRFVKGKGRTSKSKHTAKALRRSKRNVYYKLQ